MTTQLSSAAERLVQSSPRYAKWDSRTRLFLRISNILFFVALASAVGGALTDVSFVLVLAGAMSAWLVSAGLRLAREMFVMRMEHEAGT